MNICYIVLLHHKFDQAVRMIRCLSGLNIVFVVHVDASVAQIQYRQLKTDLTPYNVIFAKRERAKWGSYKAVRAIGSCIQSLISSGAPFDRCVLISGQDYPIRSNEDIISFFRANPKDEFIEAFPLDISVAKDKSWTPYYRFMRKHVWIGNRKRTIPFLRNRQPDFPLFHGSTWWALTREPIIHINNELSSDGKFCKFFKTGFLVDEAFIPTLLMNSPFAASIVGRDVVFAEWTPTSGPHPKVLLASDFERLISSNDLFARKFDAAIDVKILDMLDAAHYPAAFMKTTPRGASMPVNYRYSPDQDRA